MKFEDGVHVLLQNRLELGKATIPDIANARNPRDEIASEYSPAHYYHNWRFKNVYKDNWFYSKLKNSILFQDIKLLYLIVMKLTTIEIYDPYNSSKYIISVEYLYLLLIKKGKIVIYR